MRIGGCVGYDNGVRESRKWWEVSLCYIPQASTCYCKFCCTISEGYCLLHSLVMWVDITLQVHSTASVNFVVDLLVSKYFKYIDVRYDRFLTCQCL